MSNDILQAIGLAIATVLLFILALVAIILIYGGIMGAFFGVVYLFIKATIGLFT